MKPVLVLALGFLAGTALAQDNETLLKKIEKTMRGRTIHATVGPIETPISLDLAGVLLDSPDVTAYLIRKHHLALYRITTVAPRRWEADDGYGTRGLVTLAEKKENVRVYYAQGTHSRRRFPTLAGSAVVIMRVSALQRPKGLPRIKAAFEVYVRLRNPVVAVGVKALRPFLQETILRTFSKAFLVAQKLGTLIAKDPDPLFAEILGCPLLPSDQQVTVRESAAAFKRLAPSGQNP